MRHRRATAKLGVKSQHKRAMLANLVGSLIRHHRITTTVARAKEARRWADRLVTIAKKADQTEDRAQKVAYRRRAMAFLGQKEVVKKLFAEIGPRHADRQGGYTRVIRVGRRRGDAAELAILEWTGIAVPLATEAKEASAAAAKAEPEKKDEPKK